MSTAVTTPCRSESAYTIPTVTRPVATRAQSAIASSANALCVTIRILRLSRRSASRPPQAPSTSIGPKFSAAWIPSAVPLSVSLRPATRGRPTASRFPSPTRSARRRTGESCASARPSGTSGGSRARSWSRRALHQPLEDTGRPLEHLDLLRLEGTDALREIGLLAAATALDRSLPLGRDPDPGDAAVDGVGDALDQAGVHQGGHDATHRGGLDLLVHAEVADRHRPVGLDRGERGQARRRDTRLGLLAELPREPRDAEAQTRGELGEVDGAPGLLHTPSIVRIAN